MKTTVTIEDDVSAQLARAAQAAGVDVNKLVHDLIRDGLNRTLPPQKIEPRPFVQRTYDMGWHPGMTLEKIQQMLDEEEVEAFRRSAPEAR